MPTIEHSANRRRGFAPTLRLQGITQPFSRPLPARISFLASAVLCLLLLVIFSSCRLENGAPVSGDHPDAGSQFRGRVVLAPGVSPEPTIVANTTDPEVCGDSQSLEDVVLSEDGRALGNVIVALLDVPLESVPASEPQTLTLDNVNCRFNPHASVVTVGTTIEATNSDAVLHTTHFYGPREMNVSLPVVGAKSSRTLDRPGLYIVKCDVHGWMQAFVRVAEHPFQAVTDSSGMFHMPRVPPGIYTMELWHEKLGSIERRVEVESATTLVEIEFSQEVSP